MINIEGKEVLTELEELVDPAHTALIVIDMQRDFIEPDGLFATLGIDLVALAAAGVDDQPQWSPDGSRLLFAASGVGGGDRVFTVRADGSHLTRFG